MSSDNLLKQLIAGLRIAGFVLTVAGLGGCATSSVPSCPVGMTAMKSELLYFGTSSPDGLVTAEQWAAFLADTVTPRFPEGLSVWTAAGQWQSAAGQIEREDSYVLNVVHTGSAAEEQSFIEIIDVYKITFRQEAVLRVQSVVCGDT
jgi:hypothetical protein